MNRSRSARAIIMRPFTAADSLCRYQSGVDPIPSHLSCRRSSLSPQLVAGAIWEPYWRLRSCRGFAFWFLSSPAMNPSLPDCSPRDRLVKLATHASRPSVLQPSPFQDQDCGAAKNAGLLVAKSEGELRRYPPEVPYTLLAALCWQREREIADSLVEKALPLASAKTFPLPHKCYARGALGQCSARLVNRASRRRLALLRELPKRFVKNCSICTPTIMQSRTAIGGAKRANLPINSRLFLFELMVHIKKLRNI
jgi:hypothetical protein